jgi:pantothenate kinase
VTLIDQAARIVDAIPDPLPTSHRFVIAIAGPPAAGKSTLAAALVDALSGRAGLLAMDGFHFDDAILDERGHGDRKGAPHTFDVESYAMTLRTLRDQPSLEMAVPVYDRSLHVARNCAYAVSSAHEILVTEGNYLLIDQRPWRDLRPLFDLTVSIDVALDVVEERIRERWWIAQVDPEEARRRTEENDLPNARFVLANSSPAQLVVSQ